MIKPRVAPIGWRPVRLFVTIGWLIPIALPAFIVPAYAADNPAAPPSQDLAPGLPAGDSARAISNHDLRNVGLGAAAIAALLAIFSGGHHSSTATATATSTSQ